MEGTIISLVLGAVAGWLGGQFYKGSGLGILGNIVVGISLGSGWIGYILTAAIGAFVLLFLLNIILKKR